MPRKSVADLANNACDVVKRMNSFAKAAEVIDAALAEEIAKPAVDGLYFEVDAGALLERAEKAQVEFGSLQFVLNVLPKSVYCLGGRLEGALMGAGQVVAALRQIALATRDGKPAPIEASAVAVHRFNAASLQAQA